MSDALEHVRYSCGIAGEEVANYVDYLQAKVTELEAENAKLHEQVDLQVPKMAFTQLKEQLAAAQEEINSPPAIDAYEMYMADDEEGNPVERLRFFLSLALKGQDWIDVEKFIDDVSNHIAKAEQRVVEAIVAMLQQKHRNCFGAHSFYSAASVATANGEWRKFVKEV